MKTDLQPVPGPALDAWVARDVMGWAEWNGDDDWEGPYPMFCRWETSLAVYETEGDVTRYWSPSTDIAAAMEVRDHLWSRGVDLEMDRSFDDGRHYVITATKEAQLRENNAETLPLAICRAAVAWAEART